jgi:diacylglycerol O-acyltransferase / wax synthase
VDFLTPRVAAPNITGMQRLSGLDASFLYLETAKQPLHVCSILELDTSTMPGGYTFDRLRDALGLRIKAMPQFREKLADSRLNLDHPVWVDDKDFDVDRHPAPHRPAIAWWPTRTRRDLRTHRIASVGPQQAAVGDG